MGKGESWSARRKEEEGEVKESKRGRRKDEQRRKERLSDAETDGGVRIGHVGSSFRVVSLNSLGGLRMREKERRDGDEPERSTRLFAKEERRTRLTCSSPTR